MPVAIVTGSGGLIGSESVRHFVQDGYEVIGMENDMRARFFGPDASTAAMSEMLARSFPRSSARSRSTSATRTPSRGSSPSARPRSSW